MHYKHTKVRWAVLNIMYALCLLGSLFGQFSAVFYFLKHTKDRNRHSDYPCSPTMQPTDSCQIIPVTSFELLSFASLSVKLFALFSYTSLVAPVFCSRLIFIITSLYFFTFWRWDDDSTTTHLPSVIEKGSYKLLFEDDLLSCKKI